MPETARLVLRQFNHGDLDRWLSVISGEGVFDYFPGDVVPTRELAARMIDSMLDHWSDHGFGLWAVEDLGSGELLGRCGLQFLPETQETEVDFVLHPASWGRGYATEAARASLDHGFEALGVDEIVGLVHPGNSASKRVLEKIGMTLNRRADYFGMEVDHYSVKRVQ